MSKFNVGDKVRFIDNDSHIDMPEFYPEVNTIGEVKTIGKFNNDYVVQWPKGSTSGTDCWWVDNEQIEAVIDEDMTNEEIWEMLKPKLIKNGLDWIHYSYDAEGNNFYYFDETTLKNAVAITYKSGYYRSQKGRPFKFGKKKKGGHWEPVDPNNLPKEGTRVRYAREDKEYKEIPLIALGDSGTFALGKVSLLPGIKFDDGRFWDWICFNGAEDCLDMWVEDDE